MKCEMCGGQIDQLMVNIFNHDGSDGYYKYPFQELEENAVEIEVNPNWTGADLSEKEQMETIRCPHCGRFSFQHKEVQVYNVLKIVCFKEENLC